VAAATEESDTAITDALRELLQKTPAELVDDRYKRFRSLGAFVA